jgi:uncharacterized membrane protein
MCDSCRVLLVVAFVAEYTPARRATAHVGAASGLSLPDREFRKEQHMQGIKRKIVYVALYEAIAIACTTAGLAGVGGHETGAAGLASVLASVTAVIWNLVYNTLFEAWEARQGTRGRSVLRRVVHAIGFEGGLVLAIVPMFAWALGTSLLDAFLLDIGLVVFFMLYSFAFNWAFDLVFGLPKAALGRPGAA